MVLQMECGLRFLGSLQRLISYLVAPIYWFYATKPTVRLPSIKNPLLLKSATKLAEEIRNQTIKSEDVIRAYIQRIREINPILNAVVQDRFDIAIQEAINVDKLIESKQKTVEELEKEQPLLGVPVTIKESCSVKGMSHTGGSLHRKGVVAENDGTSVSKLRNAGAIIIAVTNTPELCLNWETNNLLFGKTVNPYNINRTPGGSSGGEAALLGAGASVIGLGSDVAGSIRIPAMFTGVFGHKPTARVVSIEGHYPISTDAMIYKFLMMGPMTRYAEDLRLMMKVLVCDKSLLADLRLDEKVDVKKLNVFYKLNAGKSLAQVPISGEIENITLQAAKYLKSIGANVSESKIDMQYTVELGCGNFGAIQNLPDLLQSRENPKEYRNIFIEIGKSLLGLSDISISALLFHFLLYINFFIPRSKTTFYQKEATNMLEDFKDMLKDNGVLLYPTFPLPAVLHYQLFIKTAGVLYTMIFNTLGMPATHATLGFDKSGLPIGCQVVAAPGHDRLCLAVAEELEKKFGGWVPPS